MADDPAATTTATKADPASPAPGHSIHGEAFDDGPRRSATILPGMGAVSFDPEAKLPEAAAFIRQGVAQLHSFYYLEAERSFRQAAKIEPAAPLAYWGMAMANVNNPKRAKGFAKEARARAEAAKASPRVRLYIDVLDAGQKEKDGEKAQVTAWEAVVQEFPKDVDARLWLAMATVAAGNLIGRQAVDSLLEAAEAAEPMHPGVHHYRIHLWDVAKPARAEASAGLYAKAAPGIAHAWHMPGHIYDPLHRYADSARHQEGSARVDHAAMAARRLMPFEIFNYAHNNQWLATDLGHVGRAREAVLVARNLVEQPRDPARNGTAEPGQAQRRGRLRWAETLARFEMWSDLLAADASGAIDWSDLPAEKTERAYWLGLARAGSGDAPGLSAQVEALRPLVDKAKPSPELAELEGYQKLLAADYVDAFDTFAKATRMRPEALARAHLKARNFGLAEAVARKGADAAPGQLPPRLALVEVLHAAGKPEDADELLDRLRPDLAQADPDLPVLRRLASAPGGWVAAIPPRSATDPRPADLSALGPLTWAPFDALPLAGVDSEGAPWSLADRRGHPVVVLFFLGGSCPHCMDQLRAFAKADADLAKIGAEVVAVSTDDPAKTAALKHNKEGVSFPMRLLPDPSLDSFRAWGAFDEFEGTPLHGVALVDGLGKVRYQAASAEPFTDVDFLKGEIARVVKLTR